MRAFGCVRADAMVGVFCKTPAPTHTRHVRPLPFAFLLPLLSNAKHERILTSKWFTCTSGLLSSVHSRFASETPTFRHGASPLCCISKRVILIRTLQPSYQVLVTRQLCRHLPGRRVSCWSVNQDQTRNSNSNQSIAADRHAARTYKSTCPGQPCQGREGSCLHVRVRPSVGQCLNVHGMHQCLALSGHAMGSITLPFGVYLPLRGDSLAEHAPLRAYNRDGCFVAAARKHRQSAA